jgi:hypothetical protein
MMKTAVIASMAVVISTERIDFVFIYGSFSN